MKPPTSALNIDSTKSRVRSVLHETALLPATAYVEEIYRIIRENHGGRFTESLILTVARQIGVPENTEMWTAVFNSVESGRDYDLAANRGLILSGSQLPIDVANLTAEFHRLLRDAPERLGLRPEAENRRRAANQRHARINVITGSGRFSSYPVFSKVHGQVRWVSCAGLQNESDETLGFLAEHVPLLRRQISDDKEQSSAHPQNDSLGQLSVKPHRHIEENDEFLAHPQHSEREYTISEAKADLKNLLFLPNSNQSRGPRRVAALNRLLAGRKYGN